MLSHTYLLALLATTSVFAAPYTTPPPGAKIVAPTDGDFTSLQDAVDSIDKNSTDTTTIFMYPGNYTGQTHITSGYQGDIIVRGYTEDDQSYAANEVTLSYNLSTGTAGGNVQSATLWVGSPGISFYNLIIENTIGDAGPSHALSAQGSQMGFYGCAITGWQDTIWVSQPDVVFKNSYIEGAVDFIYGGRANIWIETSDIGFARTRGGYITASGRTEDDPHWYIINNSRVIPKPGVTVNPGSVTLGRAWRNHARVVFQNSELSDIVSTLGWSAWAGEATYLYYAEFGNTGAGADTSGRVYWAIQLDEAVLMDDAMPNWQDWVDLDYWNAV